MKPTKLQIATLTAVLGGLVVQIAASGDAEAGRHMRVGFHLGVSGTVHVGGGYGGGGYGGYHYAPRYYPSYPRYGYGYGGGVYLGVRYAEPPPPDCYSGCGYYAQPVQPVAVATSPEPYLPRFGIGVFAGSVAVANQNQPGDDLGVLGRFRLTPHIQLEGEIAKTDLNNGARIDRRMGGALLYDFAPWSRWSIYLLGGLGVGKTEVGGGQLTADQGYGELGVGLHWNLTDSLTLVGDLRAGSRQIGGGSQAVLKSTSPVTMMDPHEDYTKGRVGLLLFF